MPASETLDHLSTEFSPTPHQPCKLGSIHTTRRTERSLYTTVLHIVVRRIRRFLGRPKEEAPKGSQRLKAAKVIYKHCTVSERQVSDIYLYDLVPRKIAGNSYSKRIYYFNGGGWQSPASPQHWQLCAKLARQMPDTAITIVAYPLAPKNAAPVAFPWLLKLYRELMQAAEEDGHRVIFAGDSSGGNIVLSLVMEAIREDEQAKSLEEGVATHTPHPVAIMAISPSTDLTRSNPEIEKIKGQDPLLTPDFIKSTAKAWVGDWDPKDRRLSPIFADASLLAKRGIRVHGVTGGFDILGPDAIAFREKCAKEGVQGQWLEWEKQMHCFPLTWPYGLPEGRESVGWMIDVLQKE